MLQLIAETNLLFLHFSRIDNLIGITNKIGFIWYQGGSRLKSAILNV